MTSTVVLRKEDWFVRSIPSWEARKLVQDHHYSRDFAGSLDPTTVHGLVRRTEGAFGRPWGVAIWYGAVFALRRYDPVLQLSRLVCIPDAPKNAASFLLRHSMGLIDRTVWPTLLTYADTGQNHTGAIYKATGWVVDGYGEGWNYYEPTTGRQLSSLQNGHFIPCPDGWEARKTRKHRFVHRAVAASSDAPALQAGEGDSQSTLPLHFSEIA